MKEIGLINRNSKYDVIWTTLMVDFTVFTLYSSHQCHMILQKSLICWFMIRNLIFPILPTLKTF